MEEHYRVGDFIAEGSYGKVYKGTKKSSGEQVAIKIISKLKMEEADLEVQANEIEILKVCNHPNIVKLVDSYED